MNVGVAYKTSWNVRKLSRTPKFTIKKEPSLKQFLQYGYLWSNSRTHEIWKSSSLVAHEFLGQYMSLVNQLVRTQLHSASPTNHR